MTHMLIMAAFEFGNPLMLFILVKTYDAPMHGDPRTRGRSIKTKLTSPAATDACQIEDPYRQVRLDIG